MRLPERSLQEFYKAMMARPDRRELLRQTETPVHWVLGMDDNLLPIKPALQQTRLSSVSFVNLYQDCGHLSMLEHPVQLAEDLSRFSAFCFNR
jgi:pimeloyl-ACP methyl ester carboxylesterase